MIHRHWLWRVKAPHFVAGFETLNGTVIKYAPILKRHVQFRSEQSAIDYLTQQGWLCRGKPVILA